MVELVAVAALEVAAETSRVFEDEVEDGALLLPAAFEMDELLFELREHAIGLELGLCNYLFSMVKTFRGAGTEYVLPERSRLDASAPFLQACSDLLAATARRRGLAGPADRGPAVDTVISGKDLLDIRSVPLVVTAEGLRDTIATALEILINKRELRPAKKHGLGPA